MIRIISPTGMGVRVVDDFGAGHFMAPRGNHYHQGTDYVCTPGQDIVAPISGEITRLAYPYANDLRWMGCVIQNKDIMIKMFYMIPTPKLLHKWISQGNIIGGAQNISNKYNTKTKHMIPHIHLEVTHINPESIREVLYENSA